MYIEIGINEENGSRHMNLELLRKTDKALNDLVHGTNKTLGKQARKELSRRKAVGFWDGTMAFVVNEENQNSAEPEKVTEYVYKPGVRKI